MCGYSGFVEVGHGKPGKSWNLPRMLWDLIVGHGKLKLFVRLVTADVKTRAKWNIETGNWVKGTQLGGQQRYICCTMSKVKKYPKTRIVLIVFESDNYTIYLISLKTGKGHRKSHWRAQKRLQTLLLILVLLVINLLPCVSCLIFLLQGTMMMSL